MPPKNMSSKETVASLTAKLEPALEKIESFAALAEKLEAILDKIEAITPVAVKLEAALIKIEEQALEIANLKARIAANESRIAANESSIISISNTADIAERLANSNAQYARRETIELYDFPKSVEDKDVEAAVIKIVAETGVKVVPSDFHAVHRKKNDKVVIAKLKCRKMARKIIKKRANLNGKSIKLGKMPTISLAKGRLYESMCDYYAFLRYKLRELHVRQRLHSFCFFNGRLWYKLEEDGARKLVTHESDLREAFPEDVDIFAKSD